MSEGIPITHSANENGLEWSEIELRLKMSRSKFPHESLFYENTWLGRAIRAYYVIFSGVKSMKTIIITHIYLHLDLQSKCTRI